MSLIAGEIRRRLTAFATRWSLRADSGCEGAQAAATPSRSSPGNGTVAERRRRLQRRVSGRAAATVRDAVGRLDDRRLERLATGRVLAAIFTGMRSRYVPAAAGGFAGAITYELRDATGRTRAWTVNVTPAGARVVTGTDPEAALTILVGVADFVRVATGELDPAYLLLSGRMDLRGEMTVAMRLGPMFGR